MNGNTCTFGGGTIVLLDSFQIYVNNSFIKVMCRNGGKIVIASPDLLGRSTLVEGLGVTGKIVSGFMWLII